MIDGNEYILKYALEKFAKKEFTELTQELYGYSWVYIDTELSNYDEKVISFGINFHLANEKYVKEVYEKARDVKYSHDIYDNICMQKNKIFYNIHFNILLYNGNYVSIKTSKLYEFVEKVKGKVIEFIEKLDKIDKE